MEITPRPDEATAAAVSAIVRQALDEEIEEGNIPETQKLIPAWVMATRGSMTGPPRSRS